MWAATWWRLIRKAFTALLDAASAPAGVPRLDPLRPDVFPDPLEAVSDGVLATGGDLSVPRLEAAYGRGFFPFYEDGPILWWSPDPRAIFELDRFHIPRRLARTTRS